MKNFGVRSLLLWVHIFALFTVLPVVSHADTYQVVYAGLHVGDYNFTELGLTADGTFVEQFSNQQYPSTGGELACPGNSAYCYFDYSAGGRDNGTPCTPMGSSRLCNTGLTFDEGTPCTVAVPNLGDRAGVCNNGHAVPADTFYLDQNGVLHLGYPYPLSQQFFYALPGTLFVNHEGDIAFTDQTAYYDQDVLFIDLTSRMSATPEPSSFALLATGLAAANALRRRGRHQS